MNKSRIYINEDETAYYEFLKNKKEKNILEKRINRLEAVIEDLLEKISALENKKESSDRG